MANMATFLQFIATHLNVYNPYMLLLLKTPNNDQFILSSTAIVKRFYCSIPND